MTNKLSSVLFYICQKQISTTFVTVILFVNTIFQLYLVILLIYRDSIDNSSVIHGFTVFFSQLPPKPRDGTNHQLRSGTALAIPRYYENVAINQVR